jgi:hypothetical protein
MCSCGCLARLERWMSGTECCCCQVQGGKGRSLKRVSIFRRADWIGSHAKPNGYTSSNSLIFFAWKQSEMKKRSDMKTKIKHTWNRATTVNVYVSKLHAANWIFTRLCVTKEEAACMCYMNVTRPNSTYNHILLFVEKDFTNWYYLRSWLIYF